MVKAPWKNAFASRPPVFVVDDEIEIAKLLVVVLQMNLFDAVPFANPQAALDVDRPGGEMSSVTNSEMVFR